jgi:hypothetical protein
MDDDKAMTLNMRMFTKAAVMAEKKAFTHIEKENHDYAVRWLTLAKECRWAATGEDGQFILAKDKS